MNLRNEKILRLFIAGHGPRDISRMLGDVTHQRVAQIIRSELARGSRHRQLLAEHAFDIHAARLESLIKVLWPRVAQGDLKAIDAARRVLEAQARLFGIGHGAAVSAPADDDLDEFDLDDEGDRDELARYRRAHRRRGGPA